MSDYTVIQYCSPVLAGIKTGNLFSWSYSSRKEVYDDLRRINRKLRRKGLTAIPLKFTEKKVLIYVYRTSSLQKDLSRPEVRHILAECGYTDLSGDQAYIRQLRKNLRDNGAFPHEIGLFLGYPPEDVAGFILNKANNYKYRGYWKVYGDVEKCRALFSKFSHCTRIYCRLAEQGRSLEELAVAR